MRFPDIRWSLCQDEGLGATSGRENIRGGRDR